MSMRAREMLIDITLIFRYMDIIMVSRGRAASRPGAVRATARARGLAHTTHRTGKSPTRQVTAVSSAIY
jgi:hypothetical protein